MDILSEGCRAAGVSGSTSDTQERLKPDPLTGNRAGGQVQVTSMPPSALTGFLRSSRPAGELGLLGMD